MAAFYTEMEKGVGKIERYGKRDIYHTFGNYAHSNHINLAKKKRPFFRTLSFEDNLQKYK
jgi:hypothetical protein